MNLKKLVRGTVIADGAGRRFAVEACFPEEDYLIISDDETGAERLGVNDLRYYTIITKPYNNIVEQRPTEVQRLVQVWDGKKPKEPKKRVLLYHWLNCGCVALDKHGDPLFWGHWCEIPVKKTLSELIKEHGDREVDEEAFFKLLGGES